MYNVFIFATAALVGKMTNQKKLHLNGVFNRCAINKFELNLTHIHSEQEEYELYQRTSHETYNA